MAKYNSLTDAFEDMNRKYKRLEGDFYRIEKDLFYGYDADIRVRTPIDTGRLRRYPHTQRDELRNHTLVWAPTKNTAKNKQFSYVGKVYYGRRLKFKDPRATHRWDSKVATQENTKYLKQFNDTVFKYFL